MMKDKEGENEQDEGNEMEGERKTKCISARSKRVEIETREQGVEKVGE